MSAVVDLQGAREARTVAAVEAILAGINRYAMPAAAREALDRQASQRRGLCERADLFRVYTWPAPALVAFIFREKGPGAAAERWHWISERELRSLAREGGYVVAQFEGEDA